jgi:hypothetical protein
MEKQVSSIINRLIEKTVKNEIAWKKTGDQCYALFLKSAWIIIENREDPVIDVYRLSFHDNSGKCVGSCCSDGSFFDLLRDLYRKASGNDPYPNRETLYEKILAELEDDDIVEKSRIK